MTFEFHFCDFKFKLFDASRESRKRVSKPLLVTKPIFVYFASDFLRSRSRSRRRETREEREREREGEGERVAMIGRKGERPRSHGGPEATRRVTLRLCRERKRRREEREDFAGRGERSECRERQTETESMKLRSGTWLQEPDPTSRLSHDRTLVECILERVTDARDMAACMSVCKTWNRIAFEHHTWRKLSKQFDHADVTDLMAKAIEKRDKTPVSSFHTTNALDDSSKRKLIMNRLLLLTKDSHKLSRPCENGVVGGFEGHSVSDLIFSMDILLDGDLLSSTCFERAHANSINKLFVNVPIGELKMDWTKPRTHLLSSSVTQRGMNLLEFIEGRLKVKIAMMRKDLKMTQIFSYDTSSMSKFNWDLTWDTENDDLDMCTCLSNCYDEWALWLYSNHCNACCKPRNSFPVSNSEDIFDEDDKVWPSPVAVPYNERTSDQIDNHFILCDIKLQLALTKTARGFEVGINHALVMELFHYWNSDGSTYYVELSDKEFLACLEKERMWY